MKKVVILLTLLLAVAIAGVLMWNSHESGGVDSAASGRADTPPVDMVALKTKAEAGDVEASYQLAKSLVKGEHGLPNYAEAAKFFQTAVDKGHVEAMVGLAELYTLGQGVTNNPPEALRLYLAGARQGNVRAMYSLAGLYEEGRGVNKDQALAAKWHQLAAERGEALAQFNLGQRYELGMGVKPDLVEAFKWLSLASKHGIEDAVEVMGRLRGKMTGEQIAEAKRRVDSFSPVTTAPLPTE